MARLTLLCAVGLVLAVASCSHALRFPSDAMTMFEELPKSVVAFQGQASSMATKPSAETAATEDMIKGMLSQGMYSDLEAMLAENENVNDNKGQGKGRRPIQIVTKFFVKPDLHVNFVHNWWRYHARSEKNKGIIHHSLSKVAGDNIVWTSYTQYEDVEAVFDHLRSEALRDFGAFLMDVNIAVEYDLVFHIGSCHCNKGSNGGNACNYFERDDAAHLAASADNKKKRSWPVRLATKFIVPPSLHHEFIEEWERLADKVEGTKGNLVFALNKPAGDNLVFVGYSAWESPSDLRSAGRKSRDFLEFLEDRNIVAITKKLWRVPSHHP